MRSGTSCWARRIPPRARPRLSRATTGGVMLVKEISGAVGGLMPYATHRTVWS